MFYIVLDTFLMLTHFEEITGNNVQLNTGFYEKSVFVCVYAHVCATAL